MPKRHSFISARLGGISQAGGQNPALPGGRKMPGEKEVNMFLNRANLEIHEAAAKPSETNKEDLTGVALTRRGTIATNGYFLVRVEAPEVDAEDYPLNGAKSVEPAEPVLMPASAVKEALGALKKIKTAHPILENACVVEAGQEKVSLLLNDLEIEKTYSIKPLPQPGIDYDRVFPTEDKPVFSIGISPRNIERLWKAIRYMNLGDDGEAPLVWHFFGAEKAVYITTETGAGQKAEILMMPVRNPDGISYEPPARWEEETKEEKEAKDEDHKEDV